MDYIKQSDGSECPKLVLTEVWNATEEALNQLETNRNEHADLSFLRDLGARGFFRGSH